MHVIAASVRWCEGEVPCADPDYDDVLALELLVFSSSIGTVEYMGAQSVARILPEDRQRAGGLLADAHCQHDSSTLVVQKVTCIFPSGAERQAHQGPQGHWATILQCALPMEDEEALAQLPESGSEEQQCAGQAPAFEVRLRLSGVVLEKTMKLCSKPPEPRRRIVACSQPLFGAGGLQSRDPHLVHDWINFHLELGVEHFQIYDLDDSFKEVLEPFSSEQVTYVPLFARRFSEKFHAASRDTNPYCLSPQAQDHCVWSWRGRADWVLQLTSPDVFLWSSAIGGLPGRLIELLDEPAEREALHGAEDGTSAPEAGRPTTGSLQAEWEITEGALVRQVEFGGPPVPGARSVIERFVWRDKMPIQVGTYEFPLAQPWNCGLMNVVNFTGRGLGHKLFRFNIETLRADHYVDMFRQRCKRCTIRDAAKQRMVPSVLAQRPENDSRTWSD
eukprot:TRINITY_DN31667_c0_g1_i1.p1 TRINITY_DN31667_c0_g1~~TRINITY_DN31667_c0_g1_i1.p1  ORF type:complete len:446 (+),score=65.66 TRINITY_DN31667_c0_g1_i1:954-2291(+)